MYCASSHVREESFLFRNADSDHLELSRNFTHFHYSINKVKELASTKDYRRGVDHAQRRLIPHFPSCER